MPHRTVCLRYIIQHWVGRSRAREHWTRQARKHNRLLTPLFLSTDSWSLCGSVLFSLLSFFAIPLKEFSRLASNFVMALVVIFSS